MPKKPSLHPIAARVLYLGLGSGRSLNAIPEMARTMGLQVSPSTVRRWSVRDGWVQAAREFDEQYGAAARMAVQPAVLREAIADNNRHANLGRALQDLGLRMIAGKTTGPDGMPLQRVDGTGGEIARLVSDGVRVERLASGMATERIDIMSSIAGIIPGQIGPAFNEVMDRVLAQIGGLDPALADPIRRTIAIERRRFGEFCDDLIDAQFRAHGLRVEDARIIEEGEGL